VLTIRSRGGLFSSVERGFARKDDLMRGRQPSPLRVGLPLRIIIPFDVAYTRRITKLVDRAASAKKRTCGFLIDGAYRLPVGWIACERIAQKEVSHQVLSSKDPDSEFALIKENTIHPGPVTGFRP